MKNEVKMNYTKQHQQVGYGKNYDKGIYSGDTWASRIWELEKWILLDILGDNQERRILDFACGTGRITK